MDKRTTFIIIYLDNFNKSLVIVELSDLFDSLDKDEMGDFIFKFKYGLGVLPLLL